MMRARIGSAGFLTGAAVGALSLALYLLTLAPTLSWGSDGKAVDGAELLAAANVLGVPHPPGYPTYTLLLKAFATIVPVGDFAFRGNLLSALLATATVVLLYAATLRLCRAVRPGAPGWQAITSSALAGMVFATAPLFWSQAVVTEVYTLNTLFLAALLLIAARLVLRPQTRPPAPAGPSLVLFGVLLGLGLGNHVTLILFAAPLVYWIGSELGWRQVASPRPLAALAVGRAVYAYLPLRSAQAPPINWGHADTLPGLVWMLTARPYQEYVFGVPVASLGSRVAQWTNLVFAQFNPLGIFLGLVGARRLLLSLPRLLVPALAAIALISIYAVTYSTVDFEVLMIPAFLLFASWTGVGLFWIASSWIPDPGKASPAGRVPARPSVRVAAVSVLGFLLLPAVSVALNFGTQDLRNDRTAYAHAGEIMRSVPDGSVVLSNRERNAFSLWYMRYVEMPERDVAVIAAPLLVFDWYLQDVHRLFPDRVPAMSGVTSQEALRRILVHNRDRRRVFLTFSNRDLATAYDLRWTGKTYEAGLK